MSSEAVIDTRYWTSTTHSTIWHDRGEQEAVRVLHTLGLYTFNTLVMGTAPASSECHERIRIILEGLEGVTQIKDDLVVHGKGQVHNDL